MVIGSFVPATSTTPVPGLPAAAELRLLIISTGEELRKARASADAPVADALLGQLLGLKRQYVDMTGEEYRAKSSKRARQACAGHALPNGLSPPKYSIPASHETRFITNVNSPHHSRKRTQIQHPPFSRVSL